MATASLNAIKRLPTLGRDITPDPREWTVEQAIEHGAPEYVDPEGSYRVTIQLGADAKWRTYNSGRWAIDAENSPPHREGQPKQHQLRHCAAVHECEEVFSGKIINGLISTHRKYLDALRHAELERMTETGSQRYTNPKATIGRQLLVLNVEPVDAPAIDNPHLVKEQRERALLAGIERIASALESE